MVATTEQKARMFDLLTGVGELVRDGKRDATKVANVLQIIKDDPKFADRLLSIRVATPSVPSEFKAWKTIKLGTGLKTADDFRRALKAGGFKISDWGNDILGKLESSVATEETEVDLVIVSVAELGFRDGASRRDIYGRAQELGLEICPPEVGPQLRLQYKEQPEGEWLLIGMDPIAASVGLLGVFYVERPDSDLWLRSLFGGPGYFWSGFYRWVFVLRK